MRWLALSFVLMASTACDGAKTDPGKASDAKLDNATDDGDVMAADVMAADVGGEDTGPEPELHPIGMKMPSFTLEDINPNSASYGKTIDSTTLAGKTYALVFLDSRCPLCADVADDLWAEYQAHPSWWEAQPTFGVARAAAIEKAPTTIDEVVDGNGLPYLTDTVETNLWMAMFAVNHDFFAVSAEGILEAWLPLYSWPDDLVVFIDHMTERHGL